MGEAVGDNLENRKIAVENHDFSTLSTGLSTRVFHSENWCGICKKVYISFFDGV